MPEYHRYKKLDISEDVTVTLPAHIWLSFISAYCASDFKDPDVTEVANAAQDQMLDPEYKKERDEAYANQRQKAGEMFEKMHGIPIPGLAHLNDDPDIPRQSGPYL